MMKPKTWLKGQLLFLMLSCSGWYSLSLPHCWRGGCSMLSVTHYQYYIDQWWRKGKLSLSLCWFSRTTLNSQHNCLWDYLCICTELSWNKCNRDCSNSFSSSFPCRVFFFPYDSPLEPLVHFFHLQLAILQFILSKWHSAKEQLPGSDPQLSPHQAIHSPWAFIKLSQPVAASA